MRANELFQQELAAERQAQEAALRKFGQVVRYCFPRTPYAHVFVLIDEDIRETVTYDRPYGMSHQEQDALAARCFAISRDGRLRAVRAVGFPVMEPVELEAAEFISFVPVQTLQQIWGRFVRGEYIDPPAVFPAGAADSSFIT